jgi:hypothetical protein
MADDRVKLAMDAAEKCSRQTYPNQGLNTLEQAIVSAAIEALDVHDRARGPSEAERRLAEIAGITDEWLSGSRSYSHAEKAVKCIRDLATRPLDGKANTIAPRRQALKDRVAAMDPEKAIDNVRDAMAQQILDMTDEEIIAEAKEDGIDIKAEAHRMCALLDHAVEQARRQAKAPGHTDLMVPPETIDAFMRDNPLPPEVVPFTREKDVALKWLLLRLEMDGLRTGDRAQASQARRLVDVAFPSGREGGGE